MPWYKNIGKSQWRRPSGEVVPPNGTFEAAAREHERITFRIRGRYSRRLALIDAPPPPAKSDDEQPPTSTTSSEELERAVSAGWKLKMRPEMYVKLHPEGGHAPLARTIIEAEAARTQKGK